MTVMTEPSSLTNKELRAIESRLVKAEMFGLGYGHVPCGCPNCNLEMFAKEYIRLLFNEVWRLRSQFDKSKVERK